MTGSSASDDDVADQETGGGPPENGGDGSTLWGILVFVAIGGALVYGGLTLQADMPSEAETETVEATVLESDFVQRGSGSDREFSVRVTYEYEIDGQSYRSSNVKAGAASYTVDTRQRAQTLVDGQWAEGSTIEAEVDPSDPETAYLVGYRRGDRIERTLGHYGLVAVGGLMILASAVSLAKKGRRWL